ncbi:hypothetical protein IJI99_00285 [bacterium]|nr:hypothetical protein [bacterium]
MLSLVGILMITAITLYIGWRVYRADPKQPSHRWFVVISVVMSLWMLFNYGSLTVDDKDLFLLYVRLVMVVTTFLPPAVYMFSLCFPRRQVTLGLSWQIAIWTWSFFLAFLNLTPFVFADACLVNGSWFPQPSWGMVPVVIHMFGFFGVAAVNFFKRSRAASGLEKIRLTYLTVGFAAAMLCALLFNLVLPAFLQDSDFMNLGIGAMSLVFIGVTGYTMMKKAFSGIDFVLAKIIYYFTLLFWLLLPLVKIYLQPIGPDLTSWLGVFPLFVLWAMILVYIFNHWEKYLINKIVNHGADWQTERENFFNDINDELDYNKILQATLDFFDKLIKNQGNWLVGDFLDNGEIIVRGEEPLKQSPKNLLTLTEKHWQREQRPIIAEEISEMRGETITKIRREMRRLKIAAVFPISYYDEFRGALLLSDKLNGNPYFIQDIEMITSTLNELAPLLNIAAIHQATKDFNRHLQQKIDYATAKLRRMNAQLIIADKLKDDFVSVASHELRTPMTAIKNYLWLVHNHNTADNIATNQKYVQIAIKSTQRLIDLVNDMLTISRIESGKYALQKEIIDVRELAVTTKQDLQPIADAKKISLTVKKPATPLLIDADSKRVLEVLHNIVGNALKFTSKGGVTMNCRADNRYVYVDVIDTGVGIDKEDFTMLFNKFARMEKSYVKIKETGTGLGLYISREIMQLHHGDIVFASEVGKGSTFTLYFPKPTKKQINKAQK